MEAELLSLADPGGNPAMPPPLLKLKAICFMCEEMLSVGANCHQIIWSPGLSPEPCWGSLQCSPDPDWWGGHTDPLTKIPTPLGVGLWPPKHSLDMPLITVSPHGTGSSKNVRLVCVNITYGIAFCESHIFYFMS